MPHLSQHQSEPLIGTTDKFKSIDPEAPLFSGARRFANKYVLKWSLFDAKAAGPASMSDIAGGTDDKIPDFSKALPLFNSAPQNNLSRLDFSDLYLCLKGKGRAHYLQKVDGQGFAPDMDVPSEYADDLGDLVELIQKQGDASDRSLTFQDMRLKVSRMVTPDGEEWVALRRMLDVPPHLGKLGFRTEVARMMSQLGKRDGLILLSGVEPRLSATAASLLHYYLESFGGLGMTVEDPINYRLEGKRGKAGFCYQSEINHEDDWGKLLKRSLNWNPRYLYVGDVRTPEAATQILRAATTGHTVIATLSSGSVEEALAGILMLTETELRERAQYVLATALTAVIHQKAIPQGMLADFIVTEPDYPGSPLRELVRSRRLSQTRTIGDQQKALLIKEGKLFMTKPTTRIHPPVGNPAARPR